MPRLPGVSWLVALASTGALRLLELRRMWQPQPPQRCHVGLSLDIAWPVQPGYRKNADHMAVLGRFSLIKRPCFVHVDCFALSIQYCHNCPTKKSHGIPLKKTCFFRIIPWKFHQSPNGFVVIWSAPTEAPIRIPVIGACARVAIQTRRVWTI